MYVCAECGAQAHVYSGEVERSCDCTGPIIAEAGAAVAGVGGMR